MIFRKAIIDDLPSIVNIYNSTIPSKIVTADTEPVTVESRMEWFNSFSDERPIWIIEDQGVIAGWMSFKSSYGRPAYRATIEIAVYINESYRNKGVGKMFIERSEVEAKKLNITTILAFIFGNNIPSIQFFKKHGYIESGNLPEVAEIEGKKIDLLILSKKV